MVLAPWAGSAADRVDRRRLLLATQLAATTLSAVFALRIAAGGVTTPEAVGFALALGGTTAFAAPALQAIVPALVDRRDLPTAVALNSVTFNLARAIGPVAGAAVVAGVGLAAAVGVNALSYLALAAALLLLTPRPGDTTAGSGTEPGREPGRHLRLRDSVRLVAGDRTLLGLLAVVAVVSLVADPVSTLTPSFAAAVFGHPDTAAGVLIGAFGAGAVLYAITVAGRFAESPRALPLLLAVLGAGIIGLGLAPSFGFAFGALALGGVGFLGAQTTATTRLQLAVDDAQRGRVMALWSVAFLGVRPVASLLDGGLAALVGVRAAAVAMGAVAFAAAFVAGRSTRRG